MPYRWPIKEGDRVATAPHTDEWMRGHRFGHVMTYTLNERGELQYYVMLDQNTSRWFDRDDLLGTVN